MKINIQKLKPNAVVPQYMTVGSAGFDLSATEAITLQPNERALIGTGLAFELNYATELQIRPRSGLAYKYGVTVLNSPATIDSDYRGEVKVLLINHGSEPFVINEGDRIAQGVIAPIEKAIFSTTNYLNETLRQNGGFGSTGSK